MRGFIPHTNEDGRVPPWKYLPATGSTKPDIGLALVLSSGKLVKASGTTKPTHICMREEPAAVPAGTLLPVIEIERDQVFEVTNSASLASVNVGQAVTISSDGLQVTGTTSSGVATIVEKTPGTGTGNPTLVKFL
jgi:hypothetical protein